MDIRDKVFGLKQQIERHNAKRTVKYCDREIVRLKCRLQKIEEEKAKIELEIELFQNSKRAIKELELGESEVSE